MWSASDRPGSQTPRRSCGSALDPRFRIGNSSARKSRTSKSERWSRSKHENRESEMETCDMRTANTLSHACTRRLHATQGKCVRKMCVRHGVCVQEIVIRTFLCTTPKFRSVYIHVECIPSTRDQEKKLVRQDQHFSSISSTWEPYSALFQSFLSPDTDNIILVLGDQIDIPNSVPFPIPSSNRTSPTIVQQVCVRTYFV